MPDIAYRAQCRCARWEGRPRPQRDPDAWLLQGVSVADPDAWLWRDVRVDGGDAAAGGEGCVDSNSEDLMQDVCIPSEEPEPDASLLADVDEPAAELTLSRAEQRDFLAGDTDSDEPAAEACTQDLSSGLQVLPARRRCDACGDLAARCLTQPKRT